MKFAVVAALLSVFASAAPLQPRQAAAIGAATPTDTQVLQYALTLENLEATYYAQALAKFNAAAFTAAGYPGWVRGRVAQIAQHEASHVKLLSAALGNNSVAACQYAFPLTDVKTFIGFSAFLENIGVSAYIGANQYITTPLYRTVAASILAVEARHEGFFSGPVALTNDWTGPYDTPLGLNMVYTLAAQLITSCPASNPALPVKSYGALTIGGQPVAAANGGQTITLSYNATASPANGMTVNAIIYNGFGSQTLPVSNGQVTIPAAIQGFSYILLTTAANATAVSTTNILAGPAELSTVFNDQASNAGFMNPFGA